MNKGIVGILIGITLSVSQMATVVTAAPGEAEFLFSNDSDGVTSYSYKIGTANEENPLNFTFYHTKLSQSNTTINEQVLLGKWVRPLSDQANVTLWTGFLKNDIRNFVSYAAMYDTNVKEDDHIWFSYGHEAVGTVEAHRKGISTNTMTLSYLHKPAEDVEVIVTAAHSAYSGVNKNNQKKFDLSLGKQFSERFKLGVAYGYNSADHLGSPDYYVPVQESVFSIVPEYNIPIGTGKMIITGKRSLTGHNHTGSIQYYSIGGELVFDSISLGGKYLKAGDYSSRTWQINWNRQL